jgi:RND family efflux transporter MFP subunit
VVYERNVEPGQVVSAMGGSPLLRVADSESLYYEAGVPEGLAGRVRAGQRVDVRCPTNGELCFQGEVERVVPVATPGTRDFMVHISVPKGTGGMKPGMFARGSVVVEEHTDTVVVPKDALVDRAGGYVVFTVKQGKAEEREVAVGLVNRTKAEVMSGVEAGEQVVVEGARALKEGDAVQVRAPVVEAAG